MISFTVASSVPWVFVFEFSLDLLARQHDATQFREVGGGN